jgi:LysR family glycine cleavage system transcriptional activator
LSFAAAAAELDLTPSAVSHQIRGLESQLGVRLFHRRRSGIALTEHGQELLQGVVQGLDCILAAADRLRHRSTFGALSLAAPADFAQLWLTPRLAVFTAQYPRVELRLITERRQRGPTANDADLAIVELRLAEIGRDPADTVLLRESIFPVAAPSLATRARPLDEPRHLHQHTLLQAEAFTRPEEDWGIWLRRLDATSIGRPRVLRFDRFDLVRQAALAGQGVALGRSALVGRDLAAGGLARPFGERSIASSRVYALRSRPAATPNPTVTALRDFLAEEAAREGGPSDAG